MHQSIRQAEILRILESTPGASVSDLCEVTGASPATIRRDLNALAESGKLNRVHGGAVPKPDQARLRGAPFARNVLRNVPQKQAIARYAADMCGEGEAIIIDAGSTTFFMCPHLRGKSVQVLTNSLPIVQELLVDESVRLHVPGGEIYREQDIILSPFENNGVNRYAASKMFMGAGGLSRRGLLQSDSILVQSEQRMMSRADAIIVLADSSKFSEEASLILCDLSRIDKVITDSGVSKNNVAMLEDAEIDVHIVDPADA